MSYNKSNTRDSSSSHRNSDKYIPRERDDRRRALCPARLRARREARHVRERKGSRAEVHARRRGSRRRPARVGGPARAGSSRHRPERLLDHRRLVQPYGARSPRLRGPRVGQTRRHGCDGANLVLHGLA